MKQLPRKKIAFCMKVMDYPDCVPLQCLRARLLQTRMPLWIDDLIAWHDSLKCTNETQRNFLLPWALSFSVAVVPSKLKQIEYSHPLSVLMIENDLAFLNVSIFPAWKKVWEMTPILWDVPLVRDGLGTLVHEKDKCQITSWRKWLMLSEDVVHHLKAGWQEPTAYTQKDNRHIKQARLLLFARLDSSTVETISKSMTTNRRHGPFWPEWESGKL